MKVILLEDVKSLGRKNDIVNVNDGYARNYILPKKLGLEATGHNLNELKLREANAEKLAEEQLEEARKFGELLTKCTVTIPIRTGENGKVFGSVSAKEISAALEEQHGYTIDRRKMVLKEPIKELGTFEVPVKLHQKVTVPLKVSVVEA